jgi:anti-sigma factor RsiW
MDDRMECNQQDRMTEWMSLALDHLLGETEERQLQHHLDACPQCQEEWALMQEASTLFEQSMMVGPPLGFAIRVERRLEAKTRQRRRLFGGIAVLTGSLSLAGVALAALALMVLGGVLWSKSGAFAEIQQSTRVVSTLASGMGLVGKGASLFLKDILLSYGGPVLLLSGIGLIALVGIWIWVYSRQPGNSHKNGVL